MFPARFFPPRFFPVGFWAKIGAEQIILAALVLDWTSETVTSAGMSSDQLRTATLLLQALTPSSIVAERLRPA